MKLRPAHGSRQHGERIGALLHRATPVENSYQLAQIHTSLEPASIAGKALKRERIGHERLPEFRESERMDGDVLSFRLLLKKGKNILDLPNGDSIEKCNSANWSVAR